MDYLVYVGVFLAGILVGRFLTPAEQITTEVPFYVVAQSGPDTDYARFHYHDGRVEVKKFRAIDLDLEMEWKGRRFRCEEWTPDGQIYREIING